MQTIELHCKKCKCSLMFSFTFSGNKETVFINGNMKCHRCKRVMALKNYTEADVVASAEKDGKLFV